MRFAELYQLPYITLNEFFPDVAKEYKNRLLDNWKYKLLIVIRVASLLLYFFKEKNIESDQMFIIELTYENNTKVIITLLQTINYSSFSPIYLPFTKIDFDKISTELFSNDGIAL